MSWEQLTFGDVLEPLSEREVPGADTSIPFIGMEHVEAQSGRVIELADASEIKSASPKVAKGDVLYGRLRPYLNKVAIAPQEAYTSGEFIVFRGNERVDAKWLKWRLTAQDFVEFACGLNTGDRPRVKWPQMKPFKIDLPSTLDEQRRIVEVLEDHLSRLDAADAGLANGLLRLRALRDSFLASVVSEARVEGEMTTVGALARKVSSGLTPLKGNKAFYEGGSIPWITSGDLHQGLITEAKNFVTQVALDETTLKVVPAGTLLVAMYGEGRTRGTSAELAIDATTNQACAAIQLSDDDLRPWVRLVLEANYSNVRRQSYGGVQPNLNLAKVKAIEVPMPSPEMREDLLAQRAELERSEARLREQLTQAQRRCTALRRSMLAAAFSGQLTGGTSEAEAA